MVLGHSNTTLSHFDVAIDVLVQLILSSHLDDFLGEAFDFRRRPRLTANSLIHSLSLCSLLTLALVHLFYKIYFGTVFQELEL